MNEPIISVSGLRGIIGESLNPIVAIRYVTAFISTIGEGPIVVTRDGRGSGSILAGAVCSGLAASGRRVLYGDVAATPTLGILVREQGAAGGIQISASHNPASYNGFKLFGSEGRVISAEEGEMVRKAYLQNPGVWPGWEHLGSIEFIKDTTSAHLQSVLKTVDQNKIAARRFKVVLDSNRGAGSILGSRLLESLGCQFEITGGRPDGLFEHMPEPTEENLQTIIGMARQFGADAVFCQDPDADRLAIIDENGSYIGEEYTLAITADHALSRNPGPVVSNCASSRMTADIAAKYGCDFHSSAVGEANVTAKMIEVSAVYGGEGNGGPIDPRVGYIRDSFVAMAQVLDVMATREKSVSGLVAELPRYEICKTVVEVERSLIPQLIDKLQDRFSDAIPNRLDGLRLDWDDRWLLLRPSNTEPIVRAIAEAKTIEAARELCRSVAETAREI